MYLRILHAHTHVAITLLLACMHLCHALKSHRHRKIGQYKTDMQTGSSPKLSQQSCMQCSDMYYTHYNDRSPCTTWSSNVSVQNPLTSCYCVETSFWCWAAPIGLATGTTLNCAGVLWGDLAGDCVLFPASDPPAKLWYCVVGDFGPECFTSPSWDLVMVNFTDDAAPEDVGLLG